ncbi:MAG: VWA domain-containing protein [Deltaproteobacteria bacterium]|nr:VWA domain-containing protein [Deltaproteobacteria bacterium]
MLRLYIFAISVAVLFTGCAGPCPNITKIDESVTAPGLVQVLFSVQCAGEPVTAVEETDITLSEGGTDVSGSESEWRLDPVAAALETYTLLLMDVSDSIIEQGTLETAQEVAKGFSESLVAQGQQVSVAIFDGDPNIRTIVDFTSNAETLADGIDSIGPGDQLDGSTNLNGAVLAGLEVLDGKVSEDVEAELVSVANLVVFTDGLDRAGRETHSRAKNTVEGSNHDTFVVALIDEEVEAEELEELGEDGFFRADDVDALTATFDELTSRLVAEVNKYYRLSYCSPLRNPRSNLKVKVSWEEKADTLKVTYPTKDFGPGCELPARSS